MALVSWSSPLLILPNRIWLVETIVLKSEMGTARVMMFTPISRILLCDFTPKDLCYSLRWAIVSELCSKEFAVQLLSSPLWIQTIKLSRLSLCATSNDISSSCRLMYSTTLIGLTALPLIDTISAC